MLGLEGKAKTREPMKNDTERNSKGFQNQRQGQAPRRTHQLGMDRYGTERGNALQVEKREPKSKQKTRRSAKEDYL